MMAGSAPMLYVFGDYTLDAEQYELRQAGGLVPLEPRVFNLLSYLVQHSGRTVPTEELLAQLYPNEFAPVDRLTNAVAQARKALGDTGQTQRYIQTVRRRGYRFIAPVVIQQQPETDADGAPPAETPLRAALPPPVAPQLRPLVATQPPALVGASAGAWEQKPVAVLAIELTWPGPTAPEALDDVPWQVPAAWQHIIVEQVQGLGGVVLQRSPSLLLVAFGTPQTLE